MKKKLLATLLSLALIVGCLTPQIVHAVPTDTTRIGGIVTDNGSPAAGYTVAIICPAGSGGNKPFTSFPTDANGHYEAPVSADEWCPYGSKVIVRADKNFHGGFTSSAVGIASQSTTINVVMGVSAVVPEYGWAGGIVAAIAGVGAIIFVRRRYAKTGIHL